jgi:hypothetical protein
VALQVALSDLLVDEVESRASTSTVVGSHGHGDDSRALCYLCGLATATAARHARPKHIPVHAVV